MNQYTTAKRKIVKQKSDLEATVTRVTNPLGGRAKMWTGKIRPIPPSSSEKCEKPARTTGEQRRTKKEGNSDHCWYTGFINIENC